MANPIYPGENPFDANEPEPDSGLFEIEQQLRDPNDMFGRRVSDKAWEKYAPAFRDLRKEVKTLRQDTDRIDKSQQEVMDFLWGPAAQRARHELGGLAKTKADADRVLTWILCPTWHYVARIAIALLSTVGLTAITVWVTQWFDK